MRPLIAYQSRDALRANFARFPKGSWAVVKADGYGMGAVDVARSLAGAPGFAVASIGEALALREAGITEAILALEGAFDLEDCREAASYGIDLVVHEPRQLQWMASLDRRQWSGVWLKLDTGMHRLGLTEQAARACADTVVGLSVGRRVWMTHYASADDTGLALPSMPSPPEGWQLSLGNSAAALLHPLPDNVCRAGIALYGASPTGDAMGLKVVQRLVSRVVALRRVAAGEAVGYSGRWIAPRDSLIATIPGGYADGYLRSMPDGTPVDVGGVVCPLAGRVSMDRITVDVTDHPGAALDMPVELWGAQVPIETVAARSGTIPYELLCNVAPRVARIWS